MSSRCEALPLDEICPECGFRHPPIPLAEAVQKVREIHATFGIYDECGHDHTDEDVAAGRAHEVNEVGTTCDEGLMYRVCLECCMDGKEYQAERCVDSHEHTKTGPVCPTVAALDGVEAPWQ